MFIQRDLNLKNFGRETKKVAQGALAQLEVFVVMRGSSYYCAAISRIFAGGGLLVTFSHWRLVDMSWYLCGLFWRKFKCGL